ncbi:cytochrome B561 [Hyphomicrobium denitrificans 1NES1]|uniref:Cytochrome B561 n=1 Tax=Hyphomicrobium denitrificans 1NES1 TaxID=670307 RepID=N0AZI6_9HYPH|nr:cytochrome b/b6 domain-containing protein [Hyphomicrobium denitrificans]AGK56534.1 cytochrome B561 [Hyphomicrobium denitrificans 1NES1]
MVEYKEYVAWDATTRWFHWINAIAVIGLIVTGLVILFDNDLGLSAAGKITLKSVHVSFGYLMALNLLWRFVWAFVGGHYSRWRSFLPGGRGYVASLRAYMASLLSGEPQQYVGHNPLARVGVTILFLLLLLQLVTGLVIAGTDLFWPPFGHWFAAWVAAPGVDPTAVVPGVPDLVEKTAYDSMRAFRKPFVEVHEIGFYVLVVTIVLHLAAVVMTEIHEGGSITSAMFTGRKLLSRRPPDAS